MGVVVVVDDDGFHVLKIDHLVSKANDDTTVTITTDVSINTTNNGDESSC